MNNIKQLLKVKSLEKKVVACLVRASRYNGS
jgi:hypothetical protein